MIGLLLQQLKIVRLQIGILSSLCLSFDALNSILTGNILVYEKIAFGLIVTNRMRYSFICFLTILG
ncbi:hypothetical protein IX321_000247 [Bacteroides pyogenes]|nr:hypothetical protein [Bacteroides pyogenes]MBR8716284.1 hypothetical protein [Bacteroides pyogenes]MBR8745780.1 hypothetical protein [Bacteroides pyogenes]MBR8756121.1 hypothetical protein [Bacteroides pyogenes]MBR8779390.1 hypothetical protein [Bacteroides pyogenes]